MKRNITFFIITSFVIFISCGRMKQENRDVIIKQLMDSINVYQEMQNGEKILSILDSLKQMKANIPDVALIYADAYAYSGDFDKAIQRLKDSIGTSSKPQLLYNELGNIYLLKQDTLEAILSYKQAINCNPNYARPYINLAELYKSKNEKELSINNYMKAVRLFGEFEFYEEVGIYANKILYLDSTNIDAHKFLQHYWYIEKDYKMALAIGLEIDRLAVEQNKLKEGYANMFFMGIILFDMGEYEKSISFMHQASEDETTAKEYGYSICCYTSASYRKLGDNEKADYFLKLAKEVNEEEAERYVNELSERNI